MLFGAVPLGLVAFGVGFELIVSGGGEWRSARGLAGTGEKEVEDEAEGKMPVRERKEIQEVLPEVTVREGVQESGCVI